MDVNLDGVFDMNTVDGPVTFSQAAAGTASRDLTAADVKAAFQWAANLGGLDHPLIFYFDDHGIKDGLLLDPFGALLSAGDLDALLDDYQAQTGNSVIVILEACHTGALAASLAGANRLVVTSTGDGLAYYSNMGALSFTHLYFNQLRKGSSFYDAWDYVKNQLPTYGFPYENQIPKLNESGRNDPAVSAALSATCLNGCWTGLAGTVSFNISSSLQSMTYATLLNLSVQAGITEGDIRKLWAMLLPPESQTTRDANGYSLTDLPVANLGTVATKSYKGGAHLPAASLAADASRTYAGKIGGFSASGRYTLTVMAEDQAGFVNVSAPVFIDYQADTAPAPIVSQTVYNNSDMVEAELPDNPDQKDRYAALMIPGVSKLVMITGLNSFEAYDGKNMPPYTGSGKLLEVTVTPSFPRGTYHLFLLGMPAGYSPLDHRDQWELGFTGFAIE